MQERAKKSEIAIRFPNLRFCTDNAAMIALAGYYQYRQGRFASLELCPK
jgi:N6-L-threonylcarbamoyladenine synthase